MKIEKHGLIITGGALNLGFAEAFLQENRFDVVVAVDGGLKYVQELQIRPDAVVGDFDTINSEILEKYLHQPDLRLERHNPVKDQTDTELAIDTAVDMGCTSLTILGALGGRMDHALGNIHLMYPCLKQGISVMIADEKNRIYLLNPGEHKFFRVSTFGKYVSFLPLSESVAGITLQGFKYPLKDADIQIGTSLCISNELSEDVGICSFQTGILICIESKD